MTTLALAAVTYAVIAAVPDSGYHLSIDHTNCFISSSVCATAAPSNIAMSPDGSFIAFVEHPNSPRFGEDRIILLHNKRRIVILRPESETLSDNVNDYSVPVLKLSDNGDLFATLNDRFSGAYMGVRERSFVWSHLHWRALVDRSSQNTSSCDNTTIAAVQSSSSYATNIDCEAEFLPSLEEAEDPQYATKSFVFNGTKTIAIGSGTVTSLSHGFAAGYSDGFHHAFRPQVLFRNKMRRIRLGAGVGFGVDDDGTVVGDNRQSWDPIGNPTLWRKTKATVINVSAGSALAIRDGIIVGCIANHAFVASSKHLPESVRLLQVIANRTEILTAFAISKSGQILALGKGDDGMIKLLILSHHNVLKR